jgi:hypothetical protein
MSNSPISPAPPAAPKRGISPLAIVLIVIGSVLAVCALGGLGVALSSGARSAAKFQGGVPSASPSGPVAQKSAPATASPVQPPAPTQAAPPPPAAAPTIEDGMFLVNSDIQPGRYKTTVPAGSNGCYWARLKGTGGTFGEIIANGYKDSGQQAIVTILKSDAAFEASGCGTWTKVG